MLVPSSWAPVLCPQAPAQHSEPTEWCGLQFVRETASTMIFFLFPVVSGSFVTHLNVLLFYDR